jgi:hypothetical protein
MVVVMVCGMVTVHANLPEREKGRAGATLSLLRAAAFFWAEDIRSTFARAFQ